jgi:outer membrane receptor protein involved in Fe transport
VLSLVRRVKPTSDYRLELQGWVTDIHQNDSEVLHESERRAGGELRTIAPVCSTGTMWAGAFGEGWEIANENNPRVGDNEFRVFVGASVPIMKALSGRSSLLYSVYRSDIKEPAGSAAITYQPISWISLTGSGEWAFRAPSYFERWGGGRLDIRDDIMEPALLYSHYDTLASSPGINPERSKTYSAKAAFSLPWNLHLAFGGYYKELVDPIVFTQIIDGGFMAQNGTTTKWQGGHVTGRWGVWDSLEVSGVWSINQAVEDTNALVPEQSGWGALTYRHTYIHNELRMLGRFEGVYWAERRGVSNQRSYILPEVIVVNFRISGTIKDFTLYWGMNNLFSKHYDLLAGFPMIHREEVVGIRWNFLD